MMKRFSDFVPTVLLMCYCFTTNIPKSSTTQLLKCVTLPPLPLNGRFKVSGQFTASLTCPTPGTDLPLNAPGQGGVLFCDPNEKNLEFNNIVVPDCIPLKIPNSIHVPILLVYTLKDCSFDLESEVVKLRDRLFPSLDALCPPSQRCSWTKPDARCETNKMYLKNNMPFQADVTFQLETSYKPQANVSSYIDKIEARKNNLFGLFEGRENLLYKWSIKSVDINFIEIGPWTATCDQFPNTIGSSLALNRIVSCRGCSRSFWFNEMRRKCSQCPFNYYTPGPYANECVVCPPENQWGSAKTQMIKLCYTRD